MTPQERDLLTNLVDRLRQAPPPEKDAEADQMIAALVRERPDTPYVLAQTVLIQDYALHQAQQRISELEQQLQHGRANQGGASFLGAIFGSGRPQGVPQPQPQPGYQQGYTQPAYAQPGGPWGAAPAAAPQQMFAPASGQPSFLRSAATTAAGIAGGALLFQGIESLLGGGHGGFGYGGVGYGGGFMPQPGLTETTINNYYDTPAPDTRQAADYQSGGQQGGVDNSGNMSDASYDTGSDFDSGGDFGGGDDFGGTDV